MRLSNSLPPITRFLLVVSSAAGLTGLALCQESGWTKERFLREAPAGWQQYRALTDRLQGSVQGSQYRVRGAEKELVQRGGQEVKHYGLWTYNKLMLSEALDRGRVPYAQARVVNSKYGFAVEQLKKNGDWVVTELDLNLQDKGPIDPQERKEAVTQFLCALLHVAQRSLAEIMKDPSFILKDVSGVEHDGREFVRVTFSVDRPAKIKYGVPSLEGWVLLDPRNLWVIRRGEMTVVHMPADKAAFTLENEYRVSGRGLPIPTSSKERKKFVTGEELLREASFDIYEQETFPEVGFSFTAFGLPEPVGVRFPQPTRWYLWFGLGALGCFVVAAGLYKISRRGLNEGDPQSAKR